MSKEMENQISISIEDEKINPCSMHPESHLYKGIGLLFICCIGFGSYFCYDAPGALEVSFDDYEYFVRIFFISLSNALNLKKQNNFIH